MDLKQAIQILSSIKLRTSTEFISINEASQRVISEDIIAQKNLPSFDNAALDGYAIKHCDKDKALRLVDCVFAGDNRDIELKDGECVKIMTGAKMPKNSDSVLRFEDSCEKDGLIYAIKGLKKGEAYRFKGEEIKSGDILFHKGQKLSSKHIFMLAAQGIYTIKVYTKPSIGVYSSGNEIIEPWQVASDEQIYNANAFGIMALLSQNGFKSSYLGIIKDDFDVTLNAFKNTNFDITICSGGASKGEADFMKDVLSNLGYKELFDHINLRPGRPAKVYQKDHKIVFILPGNPMAAYLCCMLLVLNLLGVKMHYEKATLLDDVRVKSGRFNAVLGKIENGNFFVTDGNKYGSGMITPLLKSNAILITDPDVSEICKQSEIFVLRLS